MSITFRWFRCFFILLAAFALPVAAGSPAGAGPVDGTSGQGGVTITIVQWEGQDQVHAQGGGVDDGCTYALDIGPPGFVPNLDAVGPGRPTRTWLS